MNITKLLDDNTKKIDKENERRVRSGKFSPSMLGRCYRAQYWNRKDETVTNPPDMRTKRVFQAGNLFHKFIQDLIPEGQVEVQVDTEHVGGRADIVTDDEVIDIKSQHSRSFWYMQKKKEESETQFMDRIREEKAPNLLQVAFYATILKKPNMRIAFVSKDDLCITEFVFKTEEFKALLDSEIQILINFWEENKLPKANPRCYMDKKTGKSKECTFCSWRNRCKEEESK